LFERPGETIEGSLFGFPIVAGETSEVDVIVGGASRVAELRAFETEWDGERAYIAAVRDVTEKRNAELMWRHLAHEQGEREAAEAAARRTQFLLDSMTVLAASLDTSSVIAELAKLCVRELADWVVIYVVGSGGVPQRIEVAHRDPEKRELARALRAIPIDPQGPHPVNQVLLARSPRLIDAVDSTALDAMSRNPRELEIVRGLGVHSYMEVPMIARGEALGAITLVASSDDRHFRDADLTLAQDVATRAALAIDNARLFTEARRANQSKSNFLAVVSHDLRTPLNAIIGYADLMRLGIPERIPELSLANVERIGTSANHLIYLLNELLAFARLDAGAEKAKIVDVDVHAVVRDAGTVMSPLAAGKGLQLELAIGNEPLFTRTDPDKLRQIVINLIGNAVKYTPAGHVRVTTRPVNHHRYAIEVTDTGVGIAPEHLTQIFEPFWQVNPTQRAHGQGTGLGLSVVQRMAELLGGTVAVESEKGRGSIFTVTLPRMY
jgi:signal transduction histidine kinase